MRLNCSIEQPTDSLNWDSEAADGIDYCVFYGPSIDSVIAEYRQETGEAPLPPKTALGYWQSKERYSTQKEWIAIASEYRRRRHPIDNLVQDWFYWDPWPWVLTASTPSGTRIRLQALPPSITTITCSL